MTEQEQIEETQKRFRKLTKPLCPECCVPCICRRTKRTGEFIIQYRYCTFCDYSTQTVIPE